MWDENRVLIPKKAVNLKIDKLILRIKERIKPAEVVHLSAQLSSSEKCI